MSILPVRLLAALLVVVAASLTSGPAVAATPAEIVAALNEEHSRDGIPAGIVERADWSEACRRHNDCRHQNNT